MMTLRLLLLILLLTGSSAFLSSAVTTRSTALKMAKLSEAPFKKYMVQRTIPGAGKMTPSELVAAGCGSNKINEDQGSKCVWINSFVVGDGTFCIYAAEKEEDVECHAKCLTPDGPYTITEIVGTLDVTGAYLRHGSCD